MSVMSPLTDSARSGGGAYSGRITEQSLTVQRSCRLERGSAPESVAIRGRYRTQTSIFNVISPAFKHLLLAESEFAFLISLSK